MLYIFLQWMKANILGVSKSNAKTKIAFYRLNIFYRVFIAIFIMVFVFNFSIFIRSFFFLGLKLLAFFANFCIVL